MQVTTITVNLKQEGKVIPKLGQRLWLRAVSSTYLKSPRRAREMMATAMRQRERFLHSSTEMILSVSQAS